MSNTHHGKVCRPCGETLRYISNGKCVFCMAESGKRRFAREMALKGNHKVGLPAGFVRFGTTAHKILLHIHEAGPSTHAELTEVLGANDISTNLRRLAGVARLDDDAVDRRDALG